MGFNVALSLKTFNNNATSLWQLWVLMCLFIQRNSYCLCVPPLMYLFIFISLPFSLILISNTFLHYIFWHITLHFIIYLYCNTPKSAHLKLQILLSTFSKQITLSLYIIPHLFLHLTKCNSSKNTQNPKENEILVHSVFFFHFLSSSVFCHLAKGKRGQVSRKRPGLTRDSTCVTPQAQCPQPLQLPRL